MIFFDFAGTHLMMLAPSISLYFSKQVFGEAFLKNLLQLLFVGYKKNVFFFFNFCTSSRVLSTSISGEGAQLYCRQYHRNS